MTRVSDEPAAGTEATSRQFIRLERRGRVSWLTLNRPQRLNAFEARMRGELLSGLGEALADPATGVLVIRGAGRAFCAGADIAYLRELMEQGDADRFGELVDTGREVARLLRSASKPVIAAVNGPAAGGGANLALACDLRVASETAAIGQTFVRIGLHPDWGGTFFVPRLVGTSRALELMWSGRMVAAAEALELGLFDRVVPDADLEPEVTALAEGLASAAPEAVARIKATVYAVTGGFLDSGGSVRADRAEEAESALERALTLEYENQLALLGSEDALEGLRAFLEKRTPAYREGRERDGEGGASLPRRKTRGRGGERNARS